MDLQVCIARNSSGVIIFFVISWCYFLKICFWMLNICDIIKTAVSTRTLLVIGCYENNGTDDYVENIIERNLGNKTEKN